MIPPLLAGVLMFLDPLLRRKSSGLAEEGDGFLKVTNLAELPEDGQPVRFVIRADRRDAWTMFHDQMVGSIFLRRFSATTPQQVLAFNETCPHLGCKVDYRPAEKNFFCPCHTSTFGLEGERLNQIPPRSLDALDTKVLDDGTVLVRYQEFVGGIAEKKPL